jgi:sugar phosphate isomerase/epimerase
VARYGIIQGRLSIPVNGELQCFPKDWESEFDHAKKLGFSFIELIAERDFNPENPIWTEEGRGRIINHSKEQGIQIYSACSDFIINNNIFDDISREHVLDFIDATSKIGCKLIILPFFGESNVGSKDFPELVKMMKYLGAYAAENNTRIAIETPFNPDDMISLLEKINMKENVKCVFDTGNRALLSDNLPNEIRKIDRWISHVHIKDKDLSDGNVTLGTGVVNFKEVFNAFSDIGYNGPFVFETTRGKDPLRTAAYNIYTCDYFYNESN